MASQGIEVVNEETFEQTVSLGKVLVDFYADWCGPCRMMAPVLEQVAKELKGQARVVQIDVDQAQKLASTFQVTSIPTLVLFLDGKEVGRIVGLRDAEAIKQFISSV